MQAYLACCLECFIVIYRDKNSAGILSELGTSSCLFLSGQMLEVTWCEAEHPSMETRWVWKIILERFNAGEYKDSLEERSFCSSQDVSGS